MVVPFINNCPSILLSFGYKVIICWIIFRIWFTQKQEAELALSPEGPVGPWGPVEPVAPVGPVGPPDGPVGPVGPVGPGICLPEQQHPPTFRMFFIETIYFMLSAM